MSLNYLIKDYGNGYYKLTVYPQHSARDEDTICQEYDHKLDNSLSRARNTIFEYAHCNEFDYFVTLTLSPEKYDRENLEQYIKDLGQYIRDERKRTGCNIQYVLIPELHKDGKCWHLHGLLKGVSKDDLTAFSLNDDIPFKLKLLIQSGRVIYNWNRYANKFGWVTAEPIRSRLAVSKYITKYISKSFFQGGGVTEKNKKVYYCSRGLEKASRLSEGKISDKLVSSIQFDYTNIIEDMEGIPMFLAGVKELNDQSLNELLKLLEKKNYDKN